MSILWYEDEYFSCFNYNDKDSPIIQFKEFEKGKTVAEEPGGSRILFILSGKVKYSLGNKKPILVKGDSMLFVPPDVPVNFTAIENSEVISMFLEVMPATCECFTDKEYNTKHEDGNETLPGIMDIHPRLKLYLENLKVCYNDGMRCKHYLRNKIKEMYYYLMAYYEKPKVKMFFSLIPDSDKEFSNKIITNWHLFKTAKQMAGFMNSSYSPFVKKFKKAFGENPSIWLKRKRKEAIFNELRGSNEPFKNIAEKYLFASQSLLRDFCHHNFGMSPGDIRADKRSNKHS